MDAEDYRHLVAALFPCASVRGRRTAAVAVEHELLTVDVETGAAVPVDRVRAAVDGARYAPYLGFEPGGQVELSWPCAPDVADPGARLGTRGPRRAARRTASRPASACDVEPGRRPRPSPRCRCSWTRRGTSPCSGTSTRSARRVGG